MMIRSHNSSAHMLSHKQRFSRLAVLIRPTVFILFLLALAIVLAPRAAESQSPAALSALDGTNGFKPSGASQKSRRLPLHTARNPEAPQSEIVFHL